MTLSEFKESLLGTTPPQVSNVLLKALWYDGRGDWHAAHELAQDVLTEDGSWVHAYLHRKEGDDSNASYWYRKAKRKITNSTLGEEWNGIVEELLLRNG